VDVHLVDPRDITWEINNPVFRVYFWYLQHPERADSGWASEEWEITGADVSSVQKWAEGHKNGRRFVLYARVENEDGPGLIRLQGADPLD
jgi:hypothetical protein